MGIQIDSTISRSAPRIFVVVHNNQGGNLVRGDVVEWDASGDSGATAGLSVELADSAAATLVAGVMEGATLGGGTVADQDYGLCQVYGYHSAVITDGTIAAAGDVLVSDANGDADQGTEGTQTLGIFGVALGADVSTSGEAFIRCM